jgi:Na+-driven multidrug efflux pump
VIIQNIKKLGESLLTRFFAYPAIGVLGPQADGVGNNLLVGRYAQLGLIFGTIGSIPGLVIWTFFTKDAVLWFGFDEETANIAQEFAYPFLAATFFHATGEVLDNILEIKGHERFSMWVELGRATIGTLAVFAMAMFGLKDMFLIGIVQAVLDLFLTILTVTYVLYKGWLDDFWEGLAQTSGLKVSGRKVDVSELLKAHQTQCIFSSHCRIKRQ